MFEKMNSNYRTPEFDPAAFGFDTELLNNPKGYGADGRDYILLSVCKKSGYRNRIAKLVLSEATGKMVIKMFGDRVKLAPDFEKGLLLLYAGNAKKLSRQSTTNYGYRVSISKATRPLMERYGEFKRLYLDTEVWANGNAILFTFGETSN